MPKVSKIMSRRPKAGGEDDDFEAAVPSLPPIRAERGSDFLPQEVTADRVNVAEDEGGVAPPYALQPSSPDGPVTEHQHPLANLNDAEVDAHSERDDNWNAMLYQLLLFKAQRGDLNVPHDDAGYRQLYDWVQTQRKYYQYNKTSFTSLNVDRIAVLDAIDFQWNLRGDTLWQRYFDALIVYKAEHGHVRVPRLYDKNTKLGEWVTDQRRQLKLSMEGKPNTMRDERKAKLDGLGFVWQIRDRLDWNDRYEKMLEFKKETGHCIIPQHFPQNPTLGKWVAKQREQYRFYREGKHSFLTEERIDLLKAVGFVWQMKGRGMTKGKPSKTPRRGKAERKSLAKMELIEEDEQEVISDVDSAVSENEDDEPGSSHSTKGLKGTESDPNQAMPPAMPPALPPVMPTAMPPLPSITQQQLLQANMDAIAAHPSSMQMEQQLLQANMDALAAHASSKQMVAAQLAAVLGLGGGVNPNASPLGDSTFAAMMAHMDESSSYRV